MKRLAALLLPRLLRAYAPDLVRALEMGGELVVRLPRDAQVGDLDPDVARVRSLIRRKVSEG